MSRQAKVLRTSRDVFLKMNEITPGGVHSNYRYRDPNPIYYSKASGSRVWDIEGREFIDCICNMGACVLGHGNREIVEAVSQQLKTGLTVGLETEMSYKAAELLSRIVPSAGNVKFANTGTEAMMHTIHIARGFTGKNKIAKLEGGFNGWYDYALVSTHPSLAEAGSAAQPNSVVSYAGLTRDVARETVIIPFNNIADTTRILRAHKNELAAVIVEPVMFNVGCVLPQVDYLKALREITEEISVPLVFDEIISGFRLAPGGAQAYYHVTPDLSTFAKALANGFPISAVVGREDILSITSPRSGEYLANKRAVPYFGTYNANQMSLAAAYACLNQLKTGDVQKRLHEGVNRLRKEFTAIAKDLRMDAILSGIAGKFQVYFMKDEPRNYREAVATDEKMYATFHKELMSFGVLSHSSSTAHHGITMAHSDDDLSVMLSSMERGLKRVKHAASA